MATPLMTFVCPARRAAGNGPQSRPRSHARAADAAANVSNFVSKNWVDSGGLSGTGKDSHFNRKPRNSRNLATKSEQHHHVTKCHLLGFESLSLR